MGMFARIGLSPDHGFREETLTEDQKAGLDAPPTAIGYSAAAGKEASS